MRAEIIFALIILNATAISTLRCFAGEQTIPNEPYENYLVNWSGLYTGINLGGSISTTNGVSTIGYPTYDWAASAEGDPYSLFSSRTGNATLVQSGLIGGGQIGYTWKATSDIYFSLETDFQGATTRGGGWFSNVSGAYYNGAEHRQLGYVNTVSGINWFGTSRARFGYAIRPNIILFVTGGIAYAETWASINTISLHWHPGSEITHGPVPVSPSYTSSKSLNTGWVVGGGAEWGFNRSWSLKTEALYYDLDSQIINGQYNFNVNKSAPGFIATINAATTTAKYQGIFIRSGLNYHTSWDPLQYISTNIK